METDGNALYPTIMKRGMLHFQYTFSIVAIYGFADSRLILNAFLKNGPSIINLTFLKCFKFTFSP